MASNDFIIKRDEWELLNDTELEYLNNDMRFGVRCMVDLNRQRVCFGLFSTTYAYEDHCYYYDCLPGWHEPGFRPCLYEHDLSDFFYKNGTIKNVHLPEEVIDTVISWNEEEDDNYSLAYEFCKFASEHDLKTDDYHSLNANVSTYLCRTLPGGMSYEFGNAANWRVSEICGYIEHFDLLRAV